MRLKTIIDDAFGDALFETRQGVSLYMMANEVSSDFPGGEELSDFENGLTIAQELEGLKSDLSRLEAGWNPSRDDLAASAPLLEGWGIWDSGEALPRIVGSCVGASKIGFFYREDEQIVTLQILAIDHGFAWVRDRRGFYRLAECQSPCRVFLVP